MAQQDLYNRMIQQVNNIDNSLQGTMQQIENLQGKIDGIEKLFREQMQEVKELINLIIQAFKTIRENTSDEIKLINVEIEKQIQELWEKKSLEAISEEQMKAVQKMKDINLLVEESLYMSPVMSIIQMIRRNHGTGIESQNGKTSLNLTRARAVLIPGVLFFCLNTLSIDPLVFIFVYIS